jgi:hypothetical protein
MEIFYNAGELILGALVRPEKKADYYEREYKKRYRRKHRVKSDGGRLVCVPIAHEAANRIDEHIPGIGQFMP